MHWYAVKTHARQEFRAVSELLNQSFPAWCPVFQDHKGLTHALFPGYVLVKLNLSDNTWGPIKSTRGVSTGLVKFGGEPIALRPGAVEALQARSGEQLAPESVLIALGSVMRIKSGSWEGLSGTVEWSSASRVRLLMDLLGGKVPVEMDADKVEAA